MKFAQNRIICQVAKRGPRKLAERKRRSLRAVHSSPVLQHRDGAGAVRVDHGDQHSGREIDEPDPDHGRGIQPLLQPVSVDGNGRTFCSTIRKRGKIFSGTHFKAIGLIM